MNYLSTIQKAVTNTICGLHRDERGQGMTEFVIILVAVAVVCICVALNVGSTVDGKFEVADTEMRFLCDNAMMETDGGCPDGL